MDNIFHDLTPFVKLLESDPLMLHLKSIAKSIGYQVKIVAGVLEHDGQIDEYINVSVNDKQGIEIGTYDDGDLVSYEPLFVHFKKKKIKEIKDWFAEIIQDIKKMIDFLTSGSFVVEGPVFKQGVFDSDFGSTKILQSWKESGHQYTLIQLLNNDPSTFPTIRSEITINGVKTIIVSLGGEWQ